jgi:sialate O-acetylesterase
MEPTPGQTFVQWKPTGLYNGMIAPLLNYSMKGAAWYQGESNVDRYREYQGLLTNLINDWRLKWGQGNFPFIIVQLPNFLKAKDQPSESSWAAMREAQLKTAQTVANAAVTINIDLGEWNDIHPQSKKEVGERIVLAASKLAYGEKTVATYPFFQSMTIAGNKASLTFSGCASGLTIKGGGLLKQFTIAGDDGKFVWANAKIENGKVMVWSDQIAHPVAVRYAWADNPEGINLYSNEGLPASPFRTDK